MSFRQTFPSILLVAASFVVAGCGQQGSHSEPHAITSREYHQIVALNVVTENEVRACAYSINRDMDGPVEPLNRIPWSQELSRQEIELLKKRVGKQRLLSIGGYSLTAGSFMCAAVPACLATVVSVLGGATAAGIAVNATFFTGLLGGGILENRQGKTHAQAQALTQFEATWEKIRSPESNEVTLAEFANIEKEVSEASQGDDIAGICSPVSAEILRESLPNE